MRLRLTGFLVASLAVATATPAPAVAAPAPPVNLEVEGGSGWHADIDFELRWSNPTPSLPPIAAVHYLVRGTGGGVVDGPRRIGWAATRVDIRVLDSPGEYTAVVWLEDSSGAEGAPASTPLRFDDTLPGDVEPIRPTGWIGRSELPYPLRVSHPQGTPPPAGIRGYAISVDGDPDGSPCAGWARCTDTETDLREGASGDTLAVEPREGTSYVHAVAVSGSGVRSPSVGTVRINVDRSDPVTELVGVPDGWVSRSVTLRARAADKGSGMWAGGAGGPFTAIRVDGDRPSLTPGAETEAKVIDSGVHSVAYYARDGAGNVDDGATSNGLTNKRPALAWVRIDRRAPSVAFLPSTHPDEPELIEARVDDDLSGPSPIRGWIGVRPAGSGRQFDPLPTTIDGDLLRCRWSSERYPTGSYEFEAAGFDRAGNGGAGTNRVSGAPMVLPSPLKTGTRISGRLAGRAGPMREREVRFGGRATFRGRLELTSGSPLAHAPVDVVERFDGASGLPPRTTGATTAADGTYSVRLAPGPSREVVAQFAGSRTRTRAVADAAQLDVRTRLRLRPSSRVAAVGGRPVIFSGSVDGEKMPADGVSVQLQFRLPGLPWTEFRTLSTDRRGRFRYAYRFSDDDSRGVRFLFRAYVEAQGDWPYGPGGSLPVAVRGS